MASNIEQPLPVNGKIAWRCTCFNTRKAARSVTEFYDRALAPSGVTAPQFTLLGAITMLGPGPIMRLAENLALDRTTLTRNLKILQKQGWVTLTPGEDRRERVVSLTETGKAVFDRTFPYWQRAQEKVESVLGEETWRHLQDELAKLNDLAETEIP